MQRWRSPSLLLPVLMLSASGATSHAAEWYVDASRPASGGNGLSWCSAFAGLQDALVVAEAGDSIRIADGTYVPDRGANQTPGDRASTFRLKSGVGVWGGYAGCGAVDPDARDVDLYVSILSGDLSADDGPGFTHRADNAYHVVTYDDPAAVNVVIDGFAIQSGHADGTGPLGTITNQGSAIHIRDGSIRCMAGGPTIRHCVLRDNWSLSHAALNDHGLGTTIESTVFRDNFAGEIGGGLLVFSGPTSVSGCVFENNVVAGDGGGAWTGHSDDPTCVAPSEPTFTDCTFSGNSAQFNGGFTGRGGGLFNELNKPTITGCTFLNNDADFQGGGVYSAETEMQLVGSVFSGNTSLVDTGSPSSGNGGGVWMGSGAPIVRQCTFSGNVSRLYGGGLSAEFMSARIENCDFIANRTTVARGGGIRVFGGTAIIAGCTFDSNEVLNGGAGLQIEGNADVSVLSSTFRRNITNRGGAIDVFNSRATAVNCVFTGHSNVFRVVGSVVLFVNCTLAGNTANPGATARFHSFKGQSPSQANFINCIIWNNTDDVLNEDGSQVSFTFSDVLAGWPGQGNFTLDPAFVDVSGADGIIGTLDDNLRLSDGSPVVDAGDSSALPSDLADLDGDGDTDEPIPVDLDGAQRVFGASVDMGAFESSGLCMPGYFSASGQDPCEPCPAGTFQPDSGQTTCQACAPGSGQASEGSIECIPCADGTFQPDAGQTACLSCTCDDSDLCTTDSCDTVSGDCQYVDACVIPAVSQWGLVAMSMVLLIAGSLALRGRVRASI